MAWSVDVANLGNANSVGSGPTLAVTTTSAVASGAWVFVTAGCFHATESVLSVADNSGAPLTWAIVQQHVSSSVRTALIRAYAPAGLASSTVITVTWTAAANERKVGASSFLGGSAGSAIENTATNAAGTTGWSATPTTTSSDALCIATASLDTASSSTVDANSVEDQDFVAVGVSTAVLYHRIAAGVGATAVGGTWAGAATWAAAAAAFGTGAGGSGPVQTFVPLPFMR